MANPQIENGHIDVANEIAEKLAQFRISGQEYQVLWVVLRKTWGWHKKEDFISLSQFEEATKMDHKDVVRAIKKLIEKNILYSGKSATVAKNGVKIKKYGLNKNFDTWNSGRNATIHVTVAKVPLSKGGSIAPGTVAKVPHTKETITKENNTKEIRGSVAAGKSRIFNPLGSEIIKAFEVIDPKNKTYYQNITQREACDFLLAEYGLDEILKRVSFLPHTNKLNFFPTITSPYELKEKWVKLQDAADRMRNESKKNKVKII